VNCWTGSVSIENNSQSDWLPLFSFLPVKKSAHFCFPHFPRTAEGAPNLGYLLPKGDTHYGSKWKNVSSTVKAVKLPMASSVIKYTKEGIFSLKVAQKQTTDTYARDSG
jgi:hypothetical protein